MTNHTDPTPDLHTPTPEFRAALESQVLRAFHREQSAASSRFWSGARLRTLTRLAAALLIGVAVGATPAQVQDARQRDSLLTAAQAEERMMALRLQLVRAEYVEAVKRLKIGTTSSASVAAAESELRSAELKLRSAQLDIEEIKTASLPPRDDITAPTIGGRDFVKERLELRTIAAQRTLTTAEEAAQEAKRRRDVGVETDLAVQQADVGLVQARVALMLLAAKLDLRKRFLESHPPAADVERELRKDELTNALMLAQQQVALAVSRLQLVQDGVNKGTAVRADLLRAELDVLEKRAEIVKIESQLAAVR